jgi:hypothetical protein
MIVAIHQPHFLPWLGYLDRMLQADLFILLDHVQFERRNYQNRTRILVDGLVQWLTVPVQQHSQQERLIDKQIAYVTEKESKYWGNDHVRTLRHAYRGAPFLGNYAKSLTELLERRHTSLCELNVASLNFLCRSFAIDTPILRSSELSVSGQKSKLIMNLCQAVGATHYLAGDGGSRNYLDRKAFSDGGIEVIWQNFRHPSYRQCGSSEFAPGLSAVDLLLNHGPAARGLLSGVLAPRRDESIGPALSARRNALDGGIGSPLRY